MCVLWIECCLFCGRVFDTENGKFLCIWERGIRLPDFLVVNDKHVCLEKGPTEFWPHEEEPQFPAGDNIQPISKCLDCQILLLTWMTAGLEIVKAIPDDGTVEPEYVLACDFGMLQRKGLAALNEDLAGFMRTQLNTCARANKISATLHAKARDGLDEDFLFLMNEAEFARIDGNRDLDYAHYMGEMIRRIHAAVDESIEVEINVIFAEVDRLVGGLG